MIRNTDELEINVKDFGKTIFRSKGKKKKVIEEFDGFLGFKVN